MNENENMEKYSLQVSYIHRTAHFPMAKKTLVAYSSDNCIGFVWILIDFYSKFCSSPVYLFTFLIHN